MKVLYFTIIFVLSSFVSCFCMGLLASAGLYVLIVLLNEDTYDNPYYNTGSGPDSYTT